MKRMLVVLILLVAGCAEVNMTPAWQARVVTWNATEQRIAQWASAPDACDTCVGELSREQARTFLVQRAAMWEQLIIAMQGGEPSLSEPEPIEPEPVSVLGDTLSRMGDPTYDTYTNRIDELEADDE